MAVCLETAPSQQRRLVGGRTPIPGCITEGERDARSSLVRVSTPRFRCLFSLTCFSTGYSSPGTAFTPAAFPETPNPFPTQYLNYLSTTPDLKMIKIPPKTLSVS